MQDRTEEIWEDEVPRHDLSLPDKGPAMGVVGGGQIRPQAQPWGQVNVEPIGDPHLVLPATRIVKEGEHLIRVVVTIGRLSDE